MPRQGQIIPEFLVPHEQVYINDNSIFLDEASPQIVEGLRFLCVYSSAKGQDGVLKRYTSYTDWVEENGQPNFELYGQPNMMPYAVLNSGYGIVYGMRVMPANAAYSNLVLCAKVKTVEAAGVKTLQIGYVAKYLTDLIDGDLLESGADALTVAFPTVDADGFSIYPIIAVKAKGRGKYGDVIRIRMVSDILSDKENDYKNYIMEILETDSGISKKETWRASLYKDAVVARESIFLDDKVNDVEGSTKIETMVNYDNLKVIYDMYVATRSTGETIIPYESFDFLGLRDKTTKADIVRVTRVTDATTVSIDGVDGVSMKNGTEGSFTTDAPVIKSTVADAAARLALDATAGGYVVGDLVKQTDNGKIYRLTNVASIDSEDGWLVEVFDRQAAMSDMYIKAFRGDLDKTITSKRRAPVDLILDANYEPNVKRQMVALALRRYDAKCVLDLGILQSTSHIANAALPYKTLNDRIISKECQNFDIRDPFTNKIITMTYTYDIAGRFPNHVKYVGRHVPYTGEDYTLLTGHIKNSLRPIIDADDNELREQLYDDLRMNFCECIGENKFVRAVQVTSQPIWSDLSEENNMMTLLEMKRLVEDYVTSKRYKFAEASDRLIFTEDVKRILDSFNGTKCRSVDVKFDMNKFEEERSIIHCYLEVIFRTIQKRGIIEIDINKRV
jgi:hypothetical protein